MAVPCWWQDDLCDGDWTCGDVDSCPLDPADSCAYDAKNDADGDGICGDAGLCAADADNDVDSDVACGDENTCPPDPDNDAVIIGGRVVVSKMVVGRDVDIDMATWQCALGKHGCLLLVWIAGSVVLLAGRTADTMLAFAQQRAVFSEENDVCPPSIAASPNKILKQQAAEFLAADIPSLEARATTISTEHTPALTPVSSSETAAA